MGPCDPQGFMLCMQIVFSFIMMMMIIIINIIVMTRICNDGDYYQLNVNQSCYSYSH